MKVTVKIGPVEVSIDDGNASEPASVRWLDQFERIKEAVELATRKAIQSHIQLMGDPLEEEK